MPITRAMAARGSSDNIAVKREIKDEDSEQVKDLEQIATNESYNVYYNSHTAWPDRD